MGLNDVISNAYSAMKSNPLKGDPNAANLKVPSFNTSIKNSFQSTFTSFVKDAEQGAFDDPELTKKSEELKLRIADRLKNSPSPSATVDPTSASGGGPTGGANAAPTQAKIDAANERDMQALLENEKAQAEIRMRNVPKMMAARYSQGAKMASFFGGTIDPAKFQPRNEDEARAFAERMVLDVAEGVARLGLIQANYDIAANELKNNSSDTNLRRRVAELSSEIQKQRASVDHLFKAFDARFAGTEEENLLKSSGVDLPGTDDEIKVVEDANKEVVATGKSELYDKLVEQVFSLAMNFLKMQEDMQRRDMEMYAKSRQDQAQLDKITERRLSFEAGIKRAAQRNAEFMAGLKKQ